MGSTSIPVEQFVAVVSIEVRRLFSNGVSPSWPNWVAPGDLTGALGSEATSLDLALDEATVVQVLAYSAGAESDLGPDGGWWVCFSVGFRSPESKLLMVIAAACLARLAGTSVLDESSILGKGRQIPPACLLELAATNVGSSFEEVAAGLGHPRR